MARAAAHIRRMALAAALVAAHPAVPARAQDGDARIDAPPGTGAAPARSTPALHFSLGTGTLLNRPATDFPAAGGGSQGFVSSPWSAPLFDARVSVPLTFLALGGTPLSGGAAGPTTPILSFGYSHVRDVVTARVNRGGAAPGTATTGVRGSTSINRLYLAGALAIPLIQGARDTGSLPGTDLMLGASLGYSMLTTRVPATGFSSSQSGIDYGISAGLRLQVAPKVTVEPGVEYLFNPAGNPSSDPRLMGMLRVTFAF